MKPKLVIEFLNGSCDSQEFRHLHELRCYARDHISYTGDRIKQVVQYDEYGNPATLWNHNWNAISNAGVQNYGMATH